MGCLSGIARFLLVIINIVFLLVGLAIAVVGFLLRFGGVVTNKALEIGTDQLKRAMADPTVEIDLTKMTEGLAIGFIIGGLVLMGLAIFGCCGACYKIECMLWVYGIVIVLLIIAEAVGIGLLYGKPEIIKSGIKESVKDFNGLTGKDAISLAWNVIMIQFHCCGVDNYEDFSTSKWYPTKGSKIMPLACCKEVPDKGSASTCAETENESLNNYNKGCFDAIWELSFGNMKITVTVLVICGVIQLLFILFAYLIIRSNKDKVSPI